MFFRLATFGATFSMYSRRFSNAKGLIYSTSLWQSNWHTVHTPCSIWKSSWRSHIKHMNHSLETGQNYTLLFLMKNFQTTKQNYSNTFQLEYDDDRCSNLTEESVASSHAILLIADKVTKKIFKKFRCLGIATPESGGTNWRRKQK